MDKNLIRAMVIGDGCLHKRAGDRNAHLSMVHSVAQKDYLLHKQSLLEASGIKTRNYEFNAVATKKTGKMGRYCSLRTRNLEDLTQLKDEMYPKADGFKQDTLDGLDPLHLAIIYQDDGHKSMLSKISWTNKRTGIKTIKECEFQYINSFNIALQSHGDKGVRQFCDWLMSKFGIYANVVRFTKSGPTVSIARKTEKVKFRNLIVPYMHQSMLYKLDGLLESRVKQAERLSERAAEVTETSVGATVWTASNKEDAEAGSKNLARLTA